MCAKSNRKTDNKSRNTVVLVAGISLDLLINHYKLTYCVHAAISRELGKLGTVALICKTAAGYMLLSS